ncbi:hypothetical protein GCM10027589_06470 [Actinocorallia lasiicapitis]
MIRWESISDDLLEALRSSGWSPERAIDTGPWISSLEAEGYRAHPLAVKILANMGGLVVDPLVAAGPNFNNDEPFNIDPIAAGSGQRQMALEVEEALGGSYFPIGEWMSYSSVFVEVGGRVIATGMGWIWELGNSFEEALELAISGSRPLICLHSDPGLDPWPGSVG